MKQHKGHVFQRPQTRKWYARVNYTDASGKRRELTRTANDEDHARALLAQLVTQAEQLASVPPVGITAPPLATNGQPHTTPSRPNNVPGGCRRLQRPQFGYFCHCF